MPNSSIKNLKKEPNIDILLKCRIKSKPNFFDHDNNREKLVNIQKKMKKIVIESKEGRAEK